MQGFCTGRGSKLNPESCCVMVPCKVKDRHRVEYQGPDSKLNYGRTAEFFYNDSVDLGFSNYTRAHGLVFVYSDFLPDLDPATSVWRRLPEKQYANIEWFVRPFVRAVEPYLHS